MLDVLAPQTRIPSCWNEAPLPDAACCAAWPDRLAYLDRHESVPASPALLEALNAAGTEGRTLVAGDSSGEIWRLRHGGAIHSTQLWRLQALPDSRERLLVRLRSALAVRLTDRIQHELRNPLNALSLHADLIARLLPKSGSIGQSERINPSIEVIRQRLGDLLQRQDATVALWLAPPAEADLGPLSLGAALDSCLQLLRGYLSQQDIRLRTETLQHLDERPLQRAATATQLVILALLCIAAAGARQYRAADGRTEIVLSAQPGGILEIQSALDPQALGRELADGDAAATLASLALLLEPAGLRLEAPALQALVRLTPV